MRHDDLRDLSSLWQSKTPALKLDIQAAQRRYRRQRWVMRLNIIVELLALVATSAITIWSFTQELQLLVAIWLPLVTVWGWVIFFPLNLSRWRSFNLMKSKSLNESIQDHIRLTEQEIFRWRVSFFSTLMIMLLFIVFVGARIMLQPHTQMGIRFLDAGIIAGLLLLSAWFYNRQKASQRLLKTLSE